MKKTDLAYLAGLFDGEGCIRIASQKLKRAKQGRQNELVMQVGSSDEWVCQTFKMAFGGSIGTRVAETRTRIWEWKACAKIARSCLEVLLPYLHLKRPQAEIAIAFQKAKKYRGRGKFLSDKEWALEEAQRLMVKDMKKRIKVDGS